MQIKKKNSFNYGAYICFTDKAIFCICKHFLASGVTVAEIYHNKDKKMKISPNKLIILFSTLSLMNMPVKISINRDHSRKVQILACLL